MNTVTFQNVPNNVDFATSVQLTLSDNVTPLDLTGSTLAMQLRTNATSTTVMPVIVTVTDAPNGRLTRSIAATTLTGKPAQTYVHDLVRTRPDGVRERIWAGTLALTEGVTR